MTTKRYQVVPSRIWINQKTGQKVSPFGACPWQAESERADWELVNVGFTIYDSKSNTYGMGRPPWPNASEAQAMADKWNKGV